MSSIKLTSKTDKITDYITDEDTDENTDEDTDKDIDTNENIIDDPNKICESLDKCKTYLNKKLYVNHMFSILSDLDKKIQTIPSYNVPKIQQWINSFALKISTPVIKKKIPLVQNDMRSITACMPKDEWFKIIKNNPKQNLWKYRCKIVLSFMLYQDIVIIALEPKNEIDSPFETLKDIIMEIGYFSNYSCNNGIIQIKPFLIY